MRVDLASLIRDIGARSTIATCVGVIQRLALLFRQAEESRNSLQLVVKASICMFKALSTKLHDLQKTKVESKPSSEMQVNEVCSNNQLYF